MSAAPRWWIPPVASVRDGWLHPCAPIATELPREAERVRLAATSLRLSEGTLLLRGGLLERDRPHPLADLDLILVAPPGVTVDLSPLRALGRPLDALRLDPEAPDPVLTTLALTRAVRVAGAPLEPAPVPVDAAWIAAHWYRYGALHLPRTLTSSGPRRVSEVKQLLRAAGLLRVQTHGEWSRDLHTCADWIGETEPPLKPLVAALLASLEASVPAHIDVRDLQTWLGVRWRERAPTS